MTYSNLHRVVMVGAHCRFPGNSNDPTAFFENILDGENFCSFIPEDRFSINKFSNNSERPGKTYVNRGHFIDYDYRMFDANAFGFAPAEVEFIDPQQRLLLETAWVAIENGLGDIEALRGSEAGVFIGGFTLDHLLNQLSSGGRPMIGSHSAAGATLTMLANRLSYAFDLRGPSYAIDTACSSSLVAFEAATRAIESGRCEVALVGGVNFMMRPEYFIAMSRGRFLARDGRSKSFDARADGYGRGEGAGVVILKSREKARADGDRIIAEVAGAGVGQDGRTSGITVPNRDAQESLMRRVLHDSELDPADIVHVEAHGTGTPVGDPLEFSAIGAVYGAQDRCVPCIVGSVKSNIGHLEAAAGIASVIKSAWMLKTGEIPPIADLQEPNPALELDRYAATLADRRMLLPDAPGAPCVAINSFGYGGTNAHVVLRAPEPAPTRPERSAAQCSVAVLPISARSRGALENTLETYRQAYVATEGDAEREDAIFTAARRRVHYPFRAVAFGNSPAEIARALQLYASGSATSQVVIGQAQVGRAAKTAFVYTGMGPQWWGMGRDLWERSEVYAQALREADQAFADVSGFSILNEMLKDEQESKIGRTEFAQPANFLLQMGLTRVLAAEGVVPDVVVGHSVGEVSSGWASGMLSLEQAVMVSRHRSAVQARASGLGKMLAAAISEERAESLLVRYRGSVDIAAVNAPNSLTLAGHAGAITEIAKELESQGIFARELSVEVPYHSAFMEPLKPALIDALAGLVPSEPSLGLYSTVSGLADGRPFDGQYWADNVRSPVRFADAISAMLADGVTHFVEVGPNPVLSRAMGDIFAASGASAVHVPTLSMRDTDDLSNVGRAVASLHATGSAVNWAARHPSGLPADLPGYAFDRELLWREAQSQHHDRKRISAHPLAQERRDEGTVVSDFGISRLNYLHDHVVSGTPTMPAAGYLEAFLSGARVLADSESTDPILLSSVDVKRPLILSADSGQALEMSVLPGSKIATLVSRDLTAPDKTQTHAIARIDRLPEFPAEQLDLAGLWAGMAEESEPAEIYQVLAAIGLQYGPAFQLIERLGRSRDRSVALTTLALPEAAGTVDGYTGHPCLFDGSFQAALALLQSNAVYLPTSIEALEILRPLPSRLHARIVLVAQDADRVVCDITYLSEQGEVLARLKRLTCSALERHDATSRGYGPDYEHEWEVLDPVELSDAPILLLHLPGDPLVSAMLASEHKLTCLCLSQPQVRSLIIEALLARPSSAVVISLNYHAGPGTRRDAPVDALSLLQKTLCDFGQLGRDAPLLTLVTHNAQTVLPAEVPEPMQGALAGFARVIFNETELPLNIVDLASADLRAATESKLRAVALAHELKARTGPIERAFRDGRRLAPVLRERASFEEVRTAALEPGWSEMLALEPGGLVLRPANSAAVVRHEVEAMALSPSGSVRSAGFAGVASSDATGALSFGMVPLDGAPLTRLAGVDGLLPAPELAPSVAHLAALGPIILPVMRLMATLGDTTGRRAAVAATPHGLVLGQLLQATGAVVTLIKDRDHQDALFAGLMRGEVEPFDLLAVRYATFAEATPPALWLAETARIVDLSLEAAHGSVVPARLAGYLSLARALPSETDTLALSKELATLASDPRVRELDLSQITMSLNGWQGELENAAVITVDRRQAMEVLQPNAPTFRSDGSYLVTGGFGALGRETALWLAKHGAGRILLAGRNGEQSQGAEALMAAIAAAGSEPVALRLDLADVSSSETLLAEAIAECDRVGRALRGVFHAAGVTRDGRFEEMSREAIAAVVAPKAVGASILDRLTEDCPLDYFVMYSSIATLVGNIGQSNYAAANAWLDALAVARQRRNRPGLAVRFGAISDAGMASEPAIAARLREIGLPAIPAAEALAGMGHAMQLGLPTALVSAKPHWKRYAAYDRRGSATPRMAFTTGIHLNNSAGEPTDALWQELRTATYAERLEAFAHVLRDVIAEAMRLDPVMVSLETGLDRVGLDSLLSVSVQLAIEEKLGCAVSAMALIGGQSAMEIAAQLLHERGLGADYDTKAA